MTTKRRKSQTSNANLGQKEAKQEELSEKQFSHMKGGKADRFNSKNRKSSRNNIACSYAARS